MNIPEEDSNKIFAQFLHTGYFSVPFEATSRVIEIGFNQVWLITIIINHNSAKNFHHLRLYRLWQISPLWGGPRSETCPTSGFRNDIGIMYISIP